MKIGTPDKPSLAIRVGFVGHRDLSGYNQDALRKQIESILKIIKEQFICFHQEREELGYADSSPTYFMINSLAEGADQLAAEVAIQQEFGYKLRILIPYDAETYKKAFRYNADLARNTFTELSEGSGHALIVLDCLHETPVQQAEGRHAAATLLLDNSDLLIAICDPRHESMRGGTNATVRMAENSGLPVVKISPTNFDSFELAADVLENLKMRIVDIITPHAPPSPSADSLTPEREKERKKQLYNKNRFFAEGIGRSLGNHGPDVRHLSRFYAFWWRSIICLAKALDTSSPKSTESNDSLLTRSDEIVSIQEPYQNAFDISDALSVHYMDMYRGAFTLNFLLGAIAVLCALFSYFNPPLAVLWLSAEIAALFLVWFNVYADRRWRLNEKGIEYRFVAEHFRHMVELAPLLRVTPPPRPPAHIRFSDPEPTWMNWYFRAVVRSTDIAGAFFRADRAKQKLNMNSAYLEAVRQRLCRDWLNDQQSFYSATHHQYLKITNLIHGLTVILFSITLLTCLWHWGDLVLGWFVVDQVAVNQNQYTWRDGSFFTILVAALPAFLAALHGLSKQAEFERLGERYEVMADQLDKIADKFAQLQAGTNSGLAQNMGDSAVDISRIMLDEVLEWRVTNLIHAAELT